MSQFLQLAWLRRFGSLAAIALFLPISPIASSPTHAAPRPDSGGAACRDAELIPADHPDVRSLQALIQKYKVSASYPTSFGENSITRYELNQVLKSVLVHAAELMRTRDAKLVTRADFQTLQRLQKTYSTTAASTASTEFDQFSYIYTEATELRLLPPDHPDIKLTQALAQKYKLAIANTDSLKPAAALTRYEFAARLNVALDELNAFIAQRSADVIDKADLGSLRRLQETYAAELATLRGRVDALEARTGNLNQQQFATTTRLSGEAALPIAPPRTMTGKDRLVPRVSGGQLNAPVPQSVPAPSPVLSGLPPEQRIHKPGTANTEGYNPIDENPFQRPVNNPLSTFSIDVDTASYSNVRRFISMGQQPPKDAVRIEELINYFPYDYPQPTDNKPFSVTTDLAAAPWNPKHKVVQIGIQGKQLQAAETPPSNLVFLVDVSGSMNQPNKLPLVKQSLCLLVNELKASDRVSLVVYAGQAGLVLPPTPGNQKAKIMEAIDRLEAGGSTAGGEGIRLAYEEAKKNLLPNGNNRVILATDGDFNVGVSSDAELVRLIEQKRDQGIFLTVLGFGTGNYKDSKMEQLANKGNGNYAYIDTLLEARKVLVNDVRGTLFTIAKDVKIQVEFNPAKVQAYRLIGYENRLLRDQDFNDDTKDAGEVGAGHSVTALYEVIPAGVETNIKLPSVDPLKYQTPPASAVANSNELMQVKIRYKAPKGSTSELITQAVIDRDTTLDRASANLKFATAVALYGMLLRDSEYKGSATVNTVLQLANQAKGRDREGYRGEFIRLVQRYQQLLAQQNPKDDRLSTR